MFVSVHRLYKSMRSLIFIVKVGPYKSMRIMKREDFCFCSFIFSFLSHRKHCTVKGGRGNTKETNFQVMLMSKCYTYPILSSEAIGNLLSVQSISSVTKTKIFWSLRNLF